MKHDGKMRTTSTPPTDLPTGHQPAALVIDNTYHNRPLEMNMWHVYDEITP